MNYNIYNSICQDILKEDSNLNIKFLMEKNQIDEKNLGDLLLQIKKNEYLNNSKVLNELIDEIAKSRNTLDIHKIISHKENILNTNFSTKDEISLTKNSSNIKSESTAFRFPNKKGYIIVPAGVAVFVFLYFNSLNTKSIYEDKSKKEQVNSTIAEKKVSTISKEQKNIVDKKIETSVNKIDVPINTTENNLIPKEKIEIKQKSVENEKKEISTMLDSDEKKVLVEEKKEKPKIQENNKQTSSLDIEKLDIYQKDLKNLNNKVFYNGNYYGEDDYLFGFKIFKITPTYVKFEDSANNIRKRVLFNNIEK